jgi:hypothetical protein
MRRVLLLALLWPASMLNAQEAAPPVVRATVSPETVSVGEPAELRITVLAPTWFPEPPQFPSFEIPNALVRLPPNSSRSTWATVDGERWNGVTRRYQIYPLIGARFTLGGEMLRATVADPGKSAQSYEVAVPELELLAKVPAGAEGIDPFVAGTRFDVDRTLDADVDQLDIGSAVVVTFTAELEGLHAMFIPPLSPAIDMAGVSVYLDTPKIEDAELARRREKMTLVFDAGGQFTIPATRFDWWNTETSTVETVSIPALTLDVAGPPLPEDAVDAATDEPDAPGWPRVALGLLLVVLLAIWLGPSALEQIRRLRAARRASESYAFQRLCEALRRQDARNAQHALITWLTRLDPELDSQGFAAQFGDPGLGRELDVLSRNLHGSAGHGTVAFTDIEQGLVRARRRLLEQRESASQVSLPPLNPGGSAGH